MPVLGAVKTLFEDEAPDPRHSPAREQASLHGPRNRGSVRRNELRDRPTLGSSERPVMLSQVEIRFGSVLALKEFAAERRTQAIAPCVDGMHGASAVRGRQQDAERAYEAHKVTQPSLRHRSPGMG